MSPTPSLTQTPARIPLPGMVASVLISLASTTVLTLFLTQRSQVIKAWRRIPFVVWLVFAIYIDSYLFVIASAVLEHSFGVNTSFNICESAIILCLVFYVTTKLIYLFLVEKAYSIRGSTKRRLRSKLYIFNSFGMLGVYCIIVVLNFIFRITEMKDGLCIIGMRNVSMIPLISFDAVVNVYLTILFLIPFKNLYSFKHLPRSKANIRLRSVAFRTLIGSICTMASSVVNLAVLSALHGEPGWVCLMCCNCDILFSAIVIQWVTSRDNAGTISSSVSSRDAKTHRDHGPALGRNYAPDEFQLTTPSIRTDVSLAASKSNSHDTEDADFDRDYDDSIEHAEQVIKSPTSVLVTTTIKHESEPREPQIDMRIPRMPAKAKSRGGRRNTDVDLSMASTNQDESYMTSQTMITAKPAP